MIGNEPGVRILPMIDTQQRVMAQRVHQLERAKCGTDDNIPMTKPAPDGVIVPADGGGDFTQTA